MDAFVDNAMTGYCEARDPDELIYPSTYQRIAEMILFGAPMTEPSRRGRPRTAAEWAHIMRKPRRGWAGQMTR
jgi:hypothetical protein